MDPKLLKLLQEYEAKLKPYIPEGATSTTFTVTVDMAGTMFAMNANDNTGASTNISQRIPLKKA
jgi:hypothetical protein